MMAEPVITRTELVAALEAIPIHTGRRSYAGGSLHRAPATYPDSLAGDLFDHAVAHREPEYEVGRIYVSPFGSYFQRLYGGKWLDLAIRGEVGDHYPARPLVKLVPEQVEDNVIAFPA